jgi:hypothetical protein
MKRHDLTIIIAAGIIAGILSYAISAIVFGGHKAYQLTAPKVDPISSDFAMPDTKYFNITSIDITKDITIGDTTNPNPIH